MATGPSPNDLTRQQLDELDALLQRMLAPASAKPAAPVAAVAPATPVVPAPPTEYGWRVDRPTGPAVNAPHLTPEPEPEPALAVPMALAVNHPAMKPAAVEAFPTRLFDPPPAAEPDPIPLTTAPTDIAFERIDLASVPTPMPQPVPMPTVAAEKPTEPATATASVPMLAWPVYAANQGMEAVLGEFGPLGRLLTSSPVKHALGWCGVLMLVGAGVWTARGFGLVQFPLPW